MKTLCLDFDGVIHSYVSPWKKSHIIPDPPVPGAMEFIRRAVEKFNVVIYSARTSQPGGLEAMQQYMFKHLYEHFGSEEGERVFYRLGWPLEKPAAWVTLDDRAITFTGEWPEIQTLLDFQTWNEGDKQPKGNP